jgi:hypothetical protein
LFLLLRFEYEAFAADGHVNVGAANEFNGVVDGSSEGERCLGEADFADGM